MVTNAPTACSEKNLHAQNCRNHLKISAFCVFISCMLQVFFCVLLSIISHSAWGQDTDFLHTLHYIEERPFSLPTPDEQGRYPGLSTSN